jgi:hypothetical protein
LGELRRVSRYCGPDADRFGFRPCQRKPSSILLEEFMRKCLAILSLFITLFATQTSPQAQPSPEAPALARQTLEALRLTEGMRAALPKMLDATEAMISSQYPQYSEQIKKVLPRLRTKFDSRVEDLISVAVELLVQKFSATELREIRDFAVGPRDSAAQAAFRSSPTGMKFLAMRQDFVREMTAAGEKWGSKLGQEVDEEIRNELRREDSAL